MLCLLTLLGSSTIKCVTSTILNVRSGPGTQYSIKKSLEKGDVVNIIATYNNWAQLDDGNYVHESYIGLCKTKELCAVGLLNVRRAPAVGSIIRTLTTGQKVTIYGEDEGWSIIGANEYVSSSYLSECSSTPLTPVTKDSDIILTLKRILGSEGKCQNWKQDSGNWMNGRLGYTCAGIIPSVGYQHRNSQFAYARQCLSVSPESFVKCAWDLDEFEFIRAASRIYTENYFKPGGCSSFPQPLHYVCSDIAVNSGIGRSKEYIRELGNVGSNVKEYARRMNELHRQDYIKWSAPGTQNHVFRQGWLNRAADRDKFINTF